MENMSKNKLAYTETCSACSWTNTNLLNIGDFGNSVWLCHGCIKRKIEAVNELQQQVKHSDELLLSMKRTIQAYEQRVQLLKDELDKTNKQLQTAKIDRDAYKEMWLEARKSED